ncbi:type I-E CRISPR-associated protein Cse1/CasA [Kitasatospora acidiphila]|uniref:type I-E CRISPR-associated protein Cse1/CasA n=1 Tax=Kitasatospora acidiphila TaxID=2567942 RepID=UPI002265A601|nr:type I-E CRISPR-associated protein Cse1/CasA [Kitasatospora acidiphila]
MVGHALGVPASLAERADRFKRGRFSEDERRELQAYFEKHRARFDLFDPVAPFAQAAHLRTPKDETKGSAALVATAASGNNVPLFAARTDADPLELTPAQAVHWLLHAHCWDTAAIKTGAAGDPKVKAGKTTGNPTGPLGQLGVVVPMGRSLYETLLLNLPVTPKLQVGRPQWDRDPLGPTWESRPSDGLLDLWTWQARRIRLIPEDRSDGIMVTRVVLCAGDRLDPAPATEPHTAWNLGQPTTRKASAAKAAVGERRPRRHMAGRAVWRGLEALLAPARQTTEKFETSVLLDQISGMVEDGQLAAEYPLRIETFGMVYGTQSAVVEDVLHDAIPLPLLALRADQEVHDMLLEVAEQAEKLSWAVNNLSADLRRAVGADPIPWDKGQRPGEILLHQVDPLVRRLLVAVQRAGGDELVEELRNGWEGAAWRVALSVAEPLFDAAPATAFAGRRAASAGKSAEPPLHSLGTAAYHFHRQMEAVLPRQAEALRAAQAQRKAAREESADEMAGADT